MRETPVYTKYMDTATKPLPTTDSAVPNAGIEARLVEDRTFAPPPAFIEAANVSDAGVYEKAASDPQTFWAGWADQLEWITPYQTVCEWNPPHAKWFTGGKLNASSNCLDRHIKGDKRNKAAIIFEGEPGDTRVLTYYDLWREVESVRGRAAKTWGSARATA